MENEEITRRAVELRRQISSMESQLAGLKRDLKTVETNHVHDWEDLPNTYRYVEGYTVESVAQGSDFWPGYSVPSQNITQYHRKCRICKKEEMTEDTNKKQETKTITTPKW